MEEKYFSYIDTPLGKLEIRASEVGITAVEFLKKEKEGSVTNTILRVAIKQIEEYFKGARVDFELPLDIKGTPFREKVWKELLKIPYGETISYKELALRIDNPKAIRAVGGANNKNPISIIIPCHRVIGSDNSLVGYGGGIENKKWLLEFEKRNKTLEVNGKIK
jgi:methylated-DNA-[protein]-cysteine S-methyltransferase